MHLAIINDTDDVFIEYDTEKFRELLRLYASNLEVGDAFDKVCEDLRRETIRK